VTEPVRSFTAPAGDNWGARIRAAFELVRGRRHLEALDQSPVLELLSEALDRAWVAVYPPGADGAERFFLNEAALAACQFAGCRLPPVERVAGPLPRPLMILCAGDLAHPPRP